MELSIVIFCYNERDNLSPLVHQCVSVMQKALFDYEIIIVDDGSDDGMDAVALALQEKFATVRVIRHPENLGIGMALRTGYESARKEYVCAIAGDGQFFPEELTHIAPFPFKVYYAFYRQITRYSRYRKLLTWLNRLFNQHILGIMLRDVNWTKVYRTEQYHWCKPQLKSSLIESELCAKLYKGNILPIEIPSEYGERKYGESKGGSWKTLKKAISETLKLWWVVLRFKPGHRE